jgi:malate/lactate dehydrogenase
VIKVAAHTTLESFYSWLGRVGSSIAIDVCQRELGDVILLDIVKGLPQGEALDINHLLSEQGNDCHVDGSNENKDMENSDFIAIVAGIGRKPGMIRMDLLNINASIVGRNMLRLTRFSSMGGIALTPLISMRNKQMNWWYAPGNAVSATTEAIVRNQKAVMLVSTLLDGEYGHHDVCIGVPCV